MAHIEKHEKDVFDGAAGYSKVEMQKLSQHLSELKSEVSDKTNLEAEISKELDDLLTDTMEKEIGKAPLDQITKVENRYQIDGKGLYSCMRDKLAEDKTTALTNTTVGPKVLQTFFEKKLGYKATDSTWTGESFDKQFYLNIIKYQMSKKELVPDGMPGPKTTLAILTDMGVDTSGMKRVNAAKEVNAENVKESINVGGKTMKLPASAIKFLKETFPSTDLATLPDANATENFTGVGYMTFEDESLYLGDRKDDKKEGKGVSIWKGGARYEGEYKNDTSEGKGRYIYASGEVREGTSVAGKFQGAGIQTLPDGTKKTVTFQDDKIVEKGADAGPGAVLLDTKDQHGNAIYKITDLKDLPASGRTDKKVYHFVDANGRNVYDFYGPGRVDTRGDGMKNWKKDDKGNVYVGDIIVSGKKKAYTKESAEGVSLTTERQQFYKQYVSDIKGLDIKKELQASHKDVLSDDWFKKSTISFSETGNKVDVVVQINGLFIGTIRPIDYAKDSDFNKEGTVSRLYDLIDKSAKSAEIETAYNAALEGVKKSKAYSFVDLFGQDAKYTTPYKAYFNLFEGGKVKVNTDKPQYISRVNDKGVEYIQFDLNDAAGDEDFNEKLRTPVTAVIDSDTGKFSEYKWKKVLAEKIKGIVASSTFKNSIE